MLKTYDPNLYDLIFAGIRLNEGTGDGQHIQIEMAKPPFSTKVGADGLATRTRSADRSGTIKVTLMQSSSINDLLSGIAEADRLGVNGAGVGAALLQDRGGATVFRASKAWISGVPPITLDVEASTREWEISFADGDMFHGGNPDN